MMSMESDDIFRLYVREWVVMHSIDMTITDAIDTTTGLAGPLFDKAVAWAAENLKGRIRDEDMQLTMFTDQVSHYWCHVQVFKDTLKGEFKRFGTAEHFALSSNFDEYTIVTRNSPADHDIRNYGVVKL